MAEQGRGLIREMVEAVSDKDDPYRLRQHLEGRAILEELEVLEEAREQAGKPTDKA